MVRYKPYERYKDSGVEWIGEIPEHWKIGRFKHSVEGCIGGVWGEEPWDDENDIVCVRVADFDRVKLTVNEENLTFRSIPLSQRKRRELNEGDLLIEKSGGGDQQPVGTVVINTIKLPAVCSNFIGRMPVSNRYSPYFLSYLHSAAHSIRLNVKSIKQTTGIQNLDIASYLNEKVAFPPLKEQQAIANSLDHKTSEIDNLIADKEKLITLLQEYRQAVISEAVTKGLDPNVKMKDSGIEWIGEIPEHWEVKKVKYVASINRKTLSENTPDDFEIDYIDIGAVDSTGTISAISRLDFSLAPSRARRIISPGDAIVSTVRTYLRAIAYFEDAPGNLICSTGFAVLSPYAILPKYLFRLVQSEVYINEIVSRSTEVSYPAINASEIGQLDCILPPRREQQAIVDYLDQKTSEIDTLISGIQDSIEQLKTYRQSLISEAVTGKIDVREYAAEGGVTSGQDT